jgi:hypothetical protein
MNWFSILKVLGTKSGYAQLDFDNIVEEEEDNCKKRFLEMCKRLQKMAKEIERTLPEEILNTTYWETDSFIDFNKTRDLNGEPSYSRIEILHDYEELSDIPEEVVCKALEVLETNGQRSGNVDTGDYHISSFNYFGEQRYQPRKIRSTKRVAIYGKSVHSPMATIGFVLRVYDKDVKYSQDLFDKLAGVMK